MDSKAPSSKSRWSAAAAMFGAACNLLSQILSIYRAYYLPPHRIIWDHSAIIVECISLSPLMVLFIFRRSMPIAVIYALVLFSILIGRVNQLTEFYNRDPLSLNYKIDSPGFVQLIFGGISIAIVLAWALAVLLSYPRSERSAS